ncbi:Putative stress-responsive nuclear envelope protein [Moritella viscosa]|uniref:Stress-responsive nuclear envelope protein n=1 Tax=Moritella viscosa TaxID=80854 RepID=A0A1L0A3F7_9GAMM|nr:Putative stress-responsive nuclear envelope protein [Moritella viscosa]SGZ07320.1 Putative stress-responsive nuclear envelope protein [Moritella viscosa]SGZ08388.1 Putative stress-responsive nuclear envelope protein [Moritella viscosa]SGZ17020.1 Putative stress-responsive nuclear envelope protein [Moritella viscosa]SGZ18518.1 Putative stress-responsive nuclear envelope protein [Moritella viscosa]
MRWSHGFVGPKGTDQKSLLSLAKKRLLVSQCENWRNMHNQ